MPAARNAAAHNTAAVTPERPARRKLSLVFAVIGVLVVWVVLFAPQLAGQVFVLGDAAVFRPFSDYSYERWIETGQRTLWNPYVFLGIPTAASLADQRPQWLPDVLLSVWDWLTRGSGWPLLWPQLLCHLAGMLALAALARRMFQCGPIAAATAAIVWGMAPVLVIPLAYGHDAQTTTSALIPVTLLCLHGVLSAARTPHAISWALGLAATLALQCLGGHPQFVAFTCMVIPVLALVWFGFSRRSRWAYVAVAVLLAASMSAATWWPAWDYARDSVRGLSTYSAETGHKAGALDLLALVWPHAAGFGGRTYWGPMGYTDYPNYLGVVTAGIALLALAGRGALTARLAGVLVIAMLLSMGSRFPPGAWLARLPVFSMFRTPISWLLFAQLFAALLAARGIENVTTRHDRTSPVTPWARWIPWALAAALVMLVVMAPRLERMYLQNAWPNRAEPTTRMTAVQIEEERVLEAARAIRDVEIRVALLAALAFLVVTSRRARQPAIAAVLAGLVALDLGSVSVPALRAATGAPEALRAPPAPPLAQVGKSDPLHRIYSLNALEFFSNASITWRAHSPGGSHGAPPFDWAVLRTSSLFNAPGFVRAIAVKYLQGENYAVADPTQYDVLAGGVLSWRSALPRAYAVETVRRLVPGETLQQALWSDDFDPTRVALAGEAGAVGSYPGAASTQIRWVRDESERIAFQVDAPSEAFIVLADAWAPGWRARVGGIDVPVFKVDHMLRGVRVPRGSQVVEFHYLPSSWPPAVLITRVAWAIWSILMISLGALWIGPLRRRANPAPAR